MYKYVKKSKIRLLLHQMEVEIVVQKKKQTKNTCRENKKQKLAKRAANKRNTAHTHPT